MKELDLDQLATVSGGMRWQDMRPSQNVEDRRGWSRRDSMRHRPSAPAPLPPVDRSPGSLADQLGINDIGRNLRRRR